MHFSPRKMSPDVMKACSLASTLSLEDQIRFLDFLLSEKDLVKRRELVEEALSGNRVWEQELVG